MKARAKRKYDNHIKSLKALLNNQSQKIIVHIIEEERIYRLICKPQNQKKNYCELRQS